MVLPSLEDLNYQTGTQSQGRDRQVSGTEAAHECTGTQDVRATDVG